ncbi:HTH-type transcriptional regulator immR [Megamonas hypermegale]|uniref:HTH-type transcriptional regulator immR n=1 Tax=Megamonas hypermegale TaxID=158847 RepID=A0A239U777_9FIRM|nr:helix-turn-helix transcriptional regulator [Megamonas hypermegale]SNV04934.1 HTH-type transcriptional regulator immR [Megamonas hypermegale]
MSFQKNLKYYRKKAGYKTARDFAEVLKIPYASYVAYENKKREPKYQTLIQIANALNVSIDRLIGRYDSSVFSADIEDLKQRIEDILSIQEQKNISLSLSFEHTKTLFFNINIDDTSNQEIEVDISYLKKILDDCYSKYFYSREKEILNTLSLAIVNTAISNNLDKISKLLEQENIFTTDLNDIFFNRELLVFDNPNYKDLMLQHINIYRKLEKLKDNLISNAINK